MAGTGESDGGDFFSYVDAGLRTGGAILREPTDEVVAVDAARLRELGAPLPEANRCC